MAKIKGIHKGAENWAPALQKEGTRAKGKSGGKAPMPDEKRSSAPVKMGKKVTVPDSMPKSLAKAQPLTSTKAKPAKRVLEAFEEGTRYAAKKPPTIDKGDKKGRK